MGRYGSTAIPKLFACQDIAQLLFNRFRRILLPLLAAIV